MPCCFVPGCKTGYSTQSATNERRHFFQPKQSQIERWNAAIPRKDRCQTVKSVVCDLHFSDHYVIRDFTTVVGNDTVSIPRERPTLTADAVPTLFPNLPSYLSKNVTKRKSPRKRPLPDTRSVKHCKLQDSSRDDGLSYELQQLARETFTFAEIKLEARFLAQSVDWVVTVTDECVGFAQLDVGSGGVSVNRSVVVTSNLSVSVYVRQVNVPLPENLRYVSNREHLARLLLQVKEYKLCCGNDDPNLTKFVKNCTLATFDGKVSKHRQCLAVAAENDTRCANCRQLRILLLNTKSPYKNKLRRTPVHARLKQTLQRIRRLRGRVDKFQQSLSVAKQRLRMVSADQVERTFEHVPDNMKLAIRQAVKLAKTKSKKGMRYDNKWLLSCMLLRIKSPRAYEHLRDREMLPLPSKNTLHNYINVVKAETGIHDDVLKLLQSKVTTANDRRGILCFEEIKLHEDVKFNVKTLEFEGFVDFGEFTPVGSENKKADHALVFLYRPFLGSWIQTVALYLSRGAASGDVLAKLMLKCILALESHELCVEGVVSDGAQSNRNMWSHFGVSGCLENPINWVQHPVSVSRKLYFFSDYVHLVKCVRNNLLNHGCFKFGDKFVRMDHYEVLHDVDSSQSLRVVPKLTKTHISPNNFQRMNVKLAVQLFSNSTADGLMFYKSQCVTGLEDCDETIHFTRRINRLFDVLNAKLPSQALKYQSDSIAFLSDCLRWLNEWQTDRIAETKLCDKKLCLSASTVRHIMPDCE